MPIKLNYCPFCRSNKFKDLYRIKANNTFAPLFEMDTETFQRFFSYNLRECKNCGLFYSDRVLTQSETIRFYNFENWDPLKEKEKAKDRIEDFKAFLNFLEHYTPLSQKKVVDVGCTHGLLLALAKKRGAIPTGFEINKEAIIFGRNKLNLNMIESDLLDYNFPNEKIYDIVVFFATIEHFKRPLDYLKKTYTLLKPNGLIFLTIPETCFLTKHILRYKCYNYILGHYTYPTKKQILDSLKEMGYELLFYKSSKLSMKLILYLLANFFQKLIKNIKIPIFQKSYNVHFIDPNLNILQKLLQYPLLPFSLGIARILCKKKSA